MYFFLRVLLVLIQPSYFLLKFMQLKKNQINNRNWIHFYLPAQCRFHPPALLQLCTEAPLPSGNAAPPHSAGFTPSKYPHLHGLPSCTYASPHKCATGHVFRIITFNCSLVSVSTLLLPLARPLNYSRPSHPLSTVSPPLQHGALRWSRIAA